MAEKLPVIIDNRSENKTGIVRYAYQITLQRDR